MTQSYILVVDDDSRLRRLLRRYLAGNGFCVAEAPNADEAMPLLDLIRFDIIVMDVMMPGTNGHEAARRLRQSGNQTPILMLTAMGDTDSRIQGLECGADDYLAKPFEPRELVLRITNILRRTQTISPSTDIHFGSCSFNVQTGALSRSGQPVALTGLEMSLLRLLTSRLGEAVSRPELRQIMDTDNDRTVDVQVTRLRRKVEDDPAHPLCIQTVRGQGYKLVTN